MQTFDQSLFTLFKAGEVTLRAALEAATNPHDFRVALQTAGLLPVGIKLPRRSPRIPRLCCCDPGAAAAPASKSRTSWLQLFAGAGTGCTWSAAWSATPSSDRLNPTATSISPPTPATRPRVVVRVGRRRLDQGKRFGTIGAAKDGRRIEITTHRAEAYHADSRKPDVVFADAIEADLSRRDFTVNAMALSLPDLS